MMTPDPVPCPIGGAPSPGEPPKPNWKNLLSSGGSPSGAPENGDPSPWSSCWWPNLASPGEPISTSIRTTLGRRALAVVAKALESVSAAAGRSVLGVTAAAVGAAATAAGAAGAGPANARVTPALSANAPTATKVPCQRRNRLFKFVLSMLAKQPAAAVSSSTTARAAAGRARPEGAGRAIRRSEVGSDVADGDARPEQERPVAGG